MKTRSALLLVLFCAEFALAQNLSWKSNNIHIDLEKPLSSRSIPHIQWLQPSFDYTSSADGKISIEAVVRSEPDLTELSMSLINTKTGVVVSRKPFPDIEGKIYRIEQSMQLVGDGIYTIEITASNGTGSVVSDRRSVVVGKDAMDYIAADRKDYALIFATDNYDYWDDLQNPVNDAQTIAAELTEKYSFETEVIENGTMEEVFEKLRDYSERNFKPQDQLLIFFAGHGMFDDTFGEGYVVARNSLAKDKSRTSYIAHSRLRGVINNIPCKHILLTMDVCFGGTLDPVIARSRAAVDQVSEREMLARKLSYKTRKYLTSGGKEYVSDGIAGKHSPFAAKLIESLRSYGGDDRILTLSELQVNMEKLPQLPRFGSFGEDEKLSDFVFVGKKL